MNHCDWKEDEAGVKTKVMALCVNVLERFRQSGLPCSAVSVVFGLIQNLCVNAVRTGQRKQDRSRSR